MTAIHQSRISVDDLDGCRKNAIVFADGIS
jgi:hypothetical protein